ncbi:MAG: M20/M25/M40 family metallo-hydrolase, partial [Anaerolineales bacterium]|nr:M20/M25/M40 family metallo-hydrolase [Anaerolineales bacterium]
QLLLAHIEKHSPPGVRVSARQGAGLAYPYLMSADHPGNVAAAEVLTELYGNEPYPVRVGGSVPVIPLFLQELGAYTVNFGWTLEDENLHAPNEFFRLESLPRGVRGYCLILHRLATTAL